MSRKRISICSPLPPASFIDIVKNNTEVFSAFRVHRMQKDIAALMVGDDGKLKPFSQFAKDVKPYVSHQNRVWLETEYNTAVHRAQLASEWQQFERDADVFPNLRWVPTTSPNIGEDHRVFWNVIRPVKDSFWSVHRPGDRWNCKCSLEQTDKDITPVPNGTIEKGSTPSRGLDNNPGKDGKLFNEKHPYFPKNCSACPFKSANLSALFHSLADRKDCFKCQSIDTTIHKSKPTNKKDKKYAQKINSKRTKLMSIIRIKNLSKKLPGKVRYNNIKSGNLLISKKALISCWYHALSNDETLAIISVFAKPSKLKFVRISPLGEGKDLSTEKDAHNMELKLKRGVVHYNVYEFRTKRGIYICKTEVRKQGFEIPYFIRKK